MAVMDPIKPAVLSVKMIPAVNKYYIEQLKLEPRERSIGMITVNIDDCGYTAVDEATKFADVRVVYAHSFYAGSNYPSGPLSGEFIGILAGPNPAEVRAGLNACIKCLEEEAWFYSANEDGSLAFYPHVISRTGTYLSEQCNIPVGTPIAYLIAPPIEAVYAIDAAVKAADVELKVFYAPPSETNYSGALLSGTQSACRAAAQAFRDAVLYVAKNALNF